MLFTIRFTLLSIWFLIILVPSFLLCFLRPFKRENTTFFGEALGSLGNPIMGAKYQVEGKENLDKYRPCVFIANHQSNWDILFCAELAPKQTVSLGKDQLLKVPLFGLWYWLAGNILINRTNKKKAMQSMEKVKKELTENGTSILIMPEGTRSRGRGLLPFKKGAFVTAIQAQVPIVPIVISDYQKIKYNRLKPGTIKIKILPAIPTSGLTTEDANELRDCCRDIMVETLNELNA